MVESWKANIINEAKKTGLITSVDHNPDAKIGELPLWFLLALLTNTVKAVKS